MHWSKVSTGGDSTAFTGIRSHTATVVGHKIFVFGGSDANDKFNDLLIFDTKTMFWSKPATYGLPKPHRAHSATLVGQKLYIFGGGDGPNYFKDLYILDTKSLIWSKPIVNGTPPGPRRAHTANLVGKYIYLFGGGDGNKALNEMFMLDTEDLTWSQIKALGPLPGSRGYHSSVMVSDSKMVMFGGSDGAECFSDCHQFDIPSSTWSRLTISNPSPVLAQATVAVGKKILVFGGHDASDYVNTLKFLHYDKLEWEEIKSFTGTPPQPRGYHCCCFIDHRIFVIGGYDGSKCFPEIHVLDLGIYSFLEIEK